jgi:ACS family hexuronate transporter-like MFS transporter
MWIPASVMMSCSWLSYVDRQALAVLSPVVLADTGLSAESYGVAVSAFSIGYMVGNPLWGSLLDFVGLRVGMVVAVALWTIASASHAWVGGLLGFAVARGALGFGEGATFPGALRTAMDSLPLSKFSRGMAIAYSGASLGAILAPIIVTPIALRFGWRAAFLATGALGAAWLLLWWAVAKPPLLPAHTRSALRILWPNLLERRFWLLAVSFSLGMAPLGVILYLAPLYLNRVHGLTQAQLGTILWIPALGWEAGYFFWGWVADRYVSENDRPAWIYFLLSALVLPVAATTLIQSWFAVVVLFFATLFATVGFSVVALRLGARAYGPGHTAMVGGIGAGAWSALNAGLLPLYGRWFDQLSYDAVFLSLSLIPLAGTLMWMWLSRRRIAQPEPAPTGA